uniref:Uncharacterized protein n=1 Tax=Arundo donax TaxID=35708 RepID=A0A0A9GJZ9_ARUDO
MRCFIFMKFLLCSLSTFLCLPRCSNSLIVASVTWGFIPMHTVQSFYHI